MCNQEELHSPQRLPFAGIVSDALLSGPPLVAAETAWAAAFCLQFHRLAGRLRSVSRDTKFIVTLYQIAPLTKSTNASEATATGAGGHGVMSQTTMALSSRGF